MPKLIATHPVVIAIVAVACILIPVAVTLMLKTEAQIIATTCLDERTREQIRGLVLQGLDQGLVNHTMRIFDVWTKDRADPPKTAAAGLLNGASAYMRSRAYALRWDPPLCP